MDTDEATRLLARLEEEHQRDKALLVELQKTVERYEVRTSDLGERVAELEENLARTGGELAPTPESGAALQQLRSEILLELEKSEERTAKEGAEAEKRLREERRTSAKALGELQQRIEEVTRLEGALHALETQIQRLHKVMQSLKLETDEAIQDGKKRAEGLLVLSARIDRSDKTLSQLAHEWDQQKATADSINEKLRFLEAWAERGTKQMVDLQAFGERLRKEQAEGVDQLRTLDDRRSKQLDRWGKEMSSWRSDAKELRESLAVASRRRRGEERMMAALDALKTQLEQDRQALEHLQQTREDRQRQQIEDWRQENELLWSRNEERWQQLGLENAKRDARIAQIWDTQIAHLRRQVGEFAKLIKNSQKHLVRTKK